MKALRIIGIVLLVGLVVLTVGVGLALTPAVQTWAVRKFAGNQPDMKLNIGRVAAGFTSANLENVNVVKNGIVVTAKRATAQYSAWDYLTRRRITVHDLQVDDLVLDARGSGAPAAGATASGSSSPPPASRRTADVSRSPTAADGPQERLFNGLLNQASLPFDLQIARFSIPGRALLPGDQTATFEVNGSDVSTGRQGTVDWKVDIVSSNPDSPAKALHTSGTARLHITTERRIDVFEINAVASAEGARLPSDQIKLEAKAEQPAAGGNEGYNAVVSLVRGQTVEPLMTLVGQFNATAREISGVWNLTVRSEQLAGLLTGLGLPDVAAQGSGKFSAQPDAGATRTSGEVRGTVAHPEKFSPQLAQVGTLRFHLGFDAGVTAQAANLDTLALEVTGTNGRKLAQVKTLQRVGYALDAKQVTFANPEADLANVTIDALPLAWAQPFAGTLSIESGTASMSLAVRATSDGRQVRVTPVQPLTLNGVTISRAGQKLADTLNLSVKPVAEYSEDRLRAELAELAVTTATGDALRGRITADIAQLTGNRTIAFTADTEARIVGALKPFVSSDPGPLQVRSKSEGRLNGATLHFSASSTRVARDNGPVLLTIELMQPLTLDTTANTLSTPKPDSDTLRLQLGETPLALLEPFVPGSRFSGNVAGGVITVALRSFTELSAATSQAVTLRGVSVSLDGTPMLQDVDFATEFRVQKAGDVLRYDVRRAELRQGQESLASVAVTGEFASAPKVVITARGKLDANAAALGRQPVLASSATLAQGVIQGSFEAAIRDTIEAKANLVARDLVAREGNRPIGTAVLELTTAVQNDGSSVLRVPFTLTNANRRSDLSLDGKIARTGSGVSFQGKITSGQLFVDDVKVLTALAPGGGGTQAAPASEPKPGPSAAGVPRPSSGSLPANPSAGPGTAPREPGRVAALGKRMAGFVKRGDAAAPVKDTKAFWAVAAGGVELEMRQIVYGHDFLITEVRGSATLAPEQLALNGLEGTLKGSPFRLAGAVAFNADAPKPYTLDATITVSGFDVGAFLRASDPGATPKLESIVNIEGTFNGHGVNAADLGKNTFGRFSVQGSRGVLRMLARDESTPFGGAGGITQGLAVLGGLIGRERGNDNVALAADIVSKFAELPFDRFAMQVERGADLSLQMTNIEFLSPDTRITGSGTVVGQPGAAAGRRPLQFTLQLAAKDSMAQLLDRARLLKGEPDPAGFRAMNRTFQIKGSAAKPDSTDLWRQILESVLQSAPVQNLLNRIGQ